MFDFPKAMSAIADADSRLEQIANQQKLTNGLLALLILITDQSEERATITAIERVQLISLVRTAFIDKNIPPQP